MALISENELATMLKLEDIFNFAPLAEETRKAFCSCYGVTKETFGGASG